jgi:tRNA U34 2-thiouridine synthase MnmA/TrmU
MNEIEIFGNFSGRTRKPQMALAKQYGFEDYATPAGGCCFLTDKQRYTLIPDNPRSRWAIKNRLPNK